MKTLLNEKKDKNTKGMLSQSLLDYHDFQAEGGNPDTENKWAKLAQSTLDQNQGYKEFDKYGDLFKDLTSKKEVKTDKDVVQMIISYDSKYAIGILSSEPENFTLKSFDILTHEEVFSQDFKGTYIKMNCIEQTDDGAIFGVAYQDNGHFSVMFIDNKGNVLDDLNVSKLLSLNDESTPISGFFEPLITVCFLPNAKAMIAVYHRIQQKQYHFIYSYKDKKMEGKTIQTAIQDTNQSNFPIKSFYSSVSK